MTHAEPTDTQDLRKATHAAVALRNGLLAWQAADSYVRIPQLSKAFRDNWDKRIGELKFGGIWSIDRARRNPRHPVSKRAQPIPKEEWKYGTVTIEHAVPVKRLFAEFLEADTLQKMNTIIDAYHVAVVTSEEDQLLTSAGLSQTMPDGWRLGIDDPQARWKLVGIEVEAIQ